MMKSMKNRLLTLPLLALIGFMGHALAASPPVTTVQHINMTVEPDKVDCVGVVPMKCLVVNGELFYNEIAGFKHVAGFQYQLRVERIKNSNAPTDVGQFSYRLVKVLAKYLAPPPPAPNIQYVNMTVAPHKVDCVGVVPMKCMVVNGSYFYGQITGFHHVEGFKYQLKVERTQHSNDNIPADGNRFSYRLAKVLTKQWMK